ncbi:c-type cytochrome biogenesis protein CcmI [Manganibacter manganicus]|uniref:C-type cytochrome biogenesis protein CcmI n=1 Tax=Manganibacter manganicus TaxID=1873176 RepID=A0A1V8RR38_9HYPH|nr:c-type cytochrome biogenesis protein CcmI [Pseudaminobacter manganicus]OQM75670.1 c-type cytochrome biogenesis protein CcmI [Pseudaminobacter manganicus]
MVFWFFAALLTLGASLAVLLPLANRPKSLAAGSSHDIEVYRDQLAELDRDALRGLIRPEDAEQAKTEIARRIIRAGGEEPLASTQSWALAGRGLGAVAVLAVPLISWGLYAVIGSPDLPSQSLQERLAQNPSDSSVDDLIARAEGHLAENPEDGRGWDVLAPIYLRLGRFDEAATAYRNATRLQGSTAIRAAGLGEALTNAGSGVVSADAQLAFEQALVLDKDQPKAKFYLATALVQDGKSAEAIKAWEAMLTDLPDNSPWREPVSQALAENTSRVTASSTDTGTPSPTTDNIDAAAAMAPADRNSMIETMVAGLDEKLRQNPSDPEGWMRLMRSYVVLGRAGEARAALDRGLAALGATSDDGRKFAEFAATLGLSATE